MSLMGMNRAFKKHAALIGGFFALMMLVVSISGLGNNLINRGNQPADNGPSPQDKPVATVGDLKVTKDELDQKLDQVLQRQMGMAGPISAADRDRYRVLLLSQYKQQAALTLAAKAAGINPSDDDISHERDKEWALHRGDISTSLGLPATATDSDIDKALSVQRPGLTVASLKPRMIPDEAAKSALYQADLTANMKKQVKVSEEQVKQSYDEIQVRHILVKSGEGGLPDGQAKARAEKILAEVKADPSKMPALAAQYSDDPGSKKKGGMYDWAPAGQYVPEFTAGALAAGVGKVNPEPIKTSFGYHIIKLEGERPGKDFPKDWDKAKQKYIDQYVEKQAGQMVQAAVTAQLPNVKETILDPGMLASQDEDDARTAADPKTKTAKLQDALDQLSKISKADDRSGEAPLRRAELLTQMDRPKDAIAAYEEALATRNTAATRLSLAELYLKQKDNANALKQVGEAQKLSVSDVATENQIATILQTLGEKDQATAARAKAADMIKREAQIEASERAAAAAQPTMTLTKPVEVTGGAKPAATGTTAAAAGAATGAPAASAEGAPATGPATAPAAAPSTSAAPSAAGAPAPPATAPASPTAPK